jgi:hypothetical protein
MDIPFREHSTNDRVRFGKDCSSCAYLSMTYNREEEISQLAL